MKKLLIVVLLISSMQLAFCGGIGKKNEKALGKKSEAQELFLLDMRNKLENMSKEKQNQNIESFMRLMETVASFKQQGGSMQVPVFNPVEKYKSSLELGPLTSSGNVLY